MGTAPLADSAGVGGKVLAGSRVVPPNPAGPPAPPSGGAGLFAGTPRSARGGRCRRLWVVPAVSRGPPPGFRSRKPKEIRSCSASDPPFC